jgi:hypothetical protein
MSKMVWCLMFLMLVGMAVALTPDTAEAAAYSDVSALQPWSAESNYMSLAGYLRWMTFREQAVWLSMAEANRIVAQQTGK